MSSHDDATTVALEAGLSDEDVERALASTVRRGDELVRRRNRRRAILSAVGVVALLVGGFGALQALADDQPITVQPAGSAGATTAPSTGLAPTTPTTKGSSAPTQGAGSSAFQRTEHDGIVTMTNTTPAPVPQSSVSGNGVAVGGGVAILRVAGIVSATVIDDHTVRVGFECVLNSRDRVDQVSFRRTAAGLVVKAQISGAGGGAPCAGGIGAVLDLDVPGGSLPKDLPVTAGDVTP